MPTYFDARSYGALGDGRHDDTSALQAAIDAAAAAGGGTVKVGAGTFLLTGTEGAALELREGVTLQGLGFTTVLKLADGTSGVDALVRSVGDNTGAKGLLLDANRDNTTGTVSGWVNGNSDGVVLDHVTVTDASGYGLDLRGENGNQVQVRSGFVSNSGLDGIIASGLGLSEISDTHSSDNGGNGFNVTGPLSLIEITSHDNAENGVLAQDDGSGAVHLIGGEVVSNRNDGVHLVGTQRATIEHLSFNYNDRSAINLDGAVNSQLDHNVFLVGGREGEASAVQVHDSNGTQMQNNTFIDNRTVYGGQKETLAATLLETGTSDGTQVTNNYIAASLTPPVLIGAGSQLLANGDTVIRYGTIGDDYIGYSSTRPEDSVLYGGAGNDYLGSGSGHGVLVGGAGADRLEGSGTNPVHSSTTFRYLAVSESYRTTRESHTDQIHAFNASTDKLDLAALGITGLGNGHDGTLALVYNADKGMTYLKHYDLDAEGRRFEVALKGDYRGLLTATNFQTLVAGTEGADILNGTTHGEETLVGGAGRDTLNGRGSDDRLVGGAGGDRLAGGSGADTFVFDSPADSHVSATGSTAGRDLITDFNLNEYDRLDVSALGFTGLGDGTGTTLALAYSSASDLTRLFSQTLDAQGNHFEVALTGNLVAGLGLNGIDFAHPNEPRVTDNGFTALNYLTGTDGKDTLIGGAGNDFISGGDGDDRLMGGVGEDRIEGESGADRLSGGAGGDFFFFHQTSDSYRTATASHSDLITDFNSGLDRIVVQDLGYTDLGDGTHGTLNVSYNAELDRTYVRDLTVDDQGRSFQITLEGDQQAALVYNRFNWADPYSDAALDLLGQQAHQDIAS